MCAFGARNDGHLIVEADRWYLVSCKKHSWKGKCLCAWPFSYALTRSLRLWISSLVFHLIEETFGCRVVQWHDLPVESEDFVDLSKHSLKPRGWNGRNGPHPSIIRDYAAHCMPRASAIEELAGRNGWASLRWWGWAVKCPVEPP